MQGLSEEEVFSGTEAQIIALRSEQAVLPGIGPPISMDLFMNQEKLAEHAVMRRKLLALPFGQVRKCRRDGNCFYRTYLFGLFSQMVSSERLCTRVGRELMGSKGLDCCAGQGYSRFILEEMQEAVSDSTFYRFMEKLCFWNSN